MKFVHVHVIFVITRWREISKMEKTGRVHKTIGSRSKKRHNLGKENASGGTLKRVPLRQLQTNVRDVTVAHSLLGEKKIRRDDTKQFPKAVSTTSNPTHTVADAVGGPEQTVSKVDASCQVDDPTELPIEDLYAAKPSEKYWELYAKKLREELDEANRENMKLLKEIEQLKETLKELEHKNSDGGYYAMMYNLTKNSTPDT